MDEVTVTRAHFEHWAKNFARYCFSEGWRAGGAACRQFYDDGINAADMGLSVEDTVCTDDRMVAEREAAVAHWEDFAERMAKGAWTGNYER
jgi:hypothetical protein